MIISDNTKLFLQLILVIISMIGTLFIIQYATDIQEKSYTFVVNDKYYLNDVFIHGYYIEDLNMPLTHSRRIDYSEWVKMEIGKTYSCKNTKIDMFDINPHHKSMYCEEGKMT